MVITLLLCFSFAGECSFSTSTRLSSISFDLKKHGKVREMIEHLKKKIGIIPIRIIPKSISLVDPQLDSSSFVAFLPNLVFFGVAPLLLSDSQLLLAFPMAFLQVVAFSP